MGRVILEREIFIRRVLPCYRANFQADKAYEAEPRTLAPCFSFNGKEQGINPAIIAVDIYLFFSLF
jgi:hypothetical protein